MNTKPGLLTIVELGSYLGKAKKLLPEEELEAVKLSIAADPVCGDLIPGTGGVRKLRFGAEGRGKRGGVRIVYYFYDKSMPAFLLSIFAKNEKSDLTQAERNDLSKFVRALRAKYGV